MPLPPELDRSLGELGRFVWHEHTVLLATPSVDLDHAAAFFVPLLSLPQLTHYILDGYPWRLDGTNPAVSETFARTTG